MSADTPKPVEAPPESAKASNKKPTPKKPKVKKSPKAKPVGSKKDINKSEEIRKVAKRMKAAGQRPRPKLIIEELAAKGIRIVAPQVSIVLKKMGMKPIRKRRKATAKTQGAAAALKPAKASKLSVEDLIVARKASIALGGTDRALEAIQVLKRLDGG
jgi:hypothetical protein